MIGEGTSWHPGQRVDALKRANPHVILDSN